ncbi:MAG TPA: glycoside hydrolase [Streptosporangiaceae bacterium]
MRITSVEPTELFTGTVGRPLQVIRVTVVNDGPRMLRDRAAAAAISVEGAGVSTPEPAAVSGLGPGGQRTAEVGVEIAAPYQPGSPRSVTAIARTPDGRTEQTAEITAAEPGWTMWMVSHFHYDPVWWNTQGQFTQSRLLLPDEHGQLPEARTAFELVTLHLDAARRDPDYKFVLAEIDYLKPHFDAHPEDREDLRRFIADGRIEIVGGSYNEPNTNLTSAESTIRNAVYGIGYQRDVLGADPATAWMLDVFGHDPGYPGLMAAAGLSSSSWARGPFHQWGPHGTVGSNERMQFDSEFEWISPDGTGLLTSYMANHYGAGWSTHRAPDLAAAEQAAYEQFQQLAPVAATRNVMLPVGADHVIPSRWATGIHRDWNARYVWPRFVTALPREFFAAVRAGAAGGRTWLTPQTRDMNPVYPGKDVSYIDTKQAQRAGEVAVLDAERLGTLARLAPAAEEGAGFRYPAESLDKAWRQLVYGAHHDAITGTESDQVYLDLLGGWREAWQRGDEARRDAAAHLAGLIDTRAAAEQAKPPDPLLGAVAVFNTLSRARPGMAQITLTLPEGAAPWATLLDPGGREQPCLAEGVTRHPDGSLAEVTLTFRAADVPALGYRGYLIAAAPAPPDEPGWQAIDGASIENGSYAVTADPARGGALSRIYDKRAAADLLRPGAAGNELVLQEEYDYHPRWNEGQWLLSPKGHGRPVSGPASVRAERCAAGRRLVAEVTDGDLRFTQETLLWDGSDLIEFRTHADGSIGHDRLLRVRFGADVPGGLPVYQTATAAIGRPLGVADTDVAENWFTLDNPARDWFGVGSTARVATPDGSMQAIGVAEVIIPLLPNGDAGSQAAIRELVAALAGQGVTATCSRPDGPRYGALDLDSNLPDFRIALGGPEQNPFTAEVLAAAGLDAPDGRLWVPAGRSRAEAFVAGADVRAARDLPVLIVTWPPGGLAAAVGALARDLADSVIEVPAARLGEPLAGRSVALLNRGTPGGLVTPDGTLHLSLMRSSSAWPSGVWIDGERRTAPDGSSFAWQHWSHTFEYALAAGTGDWRAARFTAAGEDYNHDLVTCPTGLHAGPLPAEASLGSVDPPEVTLTALKPRGNPLASGRPGGPGQADAGPADFGVVMRLRETVGRPTRATVQLTTAASPRHTDLLEEADGATLDTEDGAAVVGLPPCGLASVAFSQPPPLPLAPAPPATAAPPAPGTGVDVRIESHQREANRGSTTVRPGAEPAQPVFTRYWLHGKGPAPAGNLPVAVHISPGRAALDAGQDASVSLRVTVACGPEPAAGLAELDLPGALTADPTGPAGPAGPLAYDLPPRGHAAWDVTVRAAPRAVPGRYFVAARIRDGLGQLLEDAALVTVGEPDSPDLSLPLDELLPLIEADQQAAGAELDLTLAGQALVLAPGERGELAVSIGNRAGSAIRGEAQLVSPFGSWNSLGPWTLGFSAGPGAAVTLRYPVSVPARARPGTQWWAIVKVMYFGRVRYTPAVLVTVRR